MNNRTEITKSKKFTSGPFAITDIHNGGNVFATIYLVELEFDNQNNVVLKTILVKEGLSEWNQSVKKLDVKGKCFENSKHLELKMFDIEGNKCDGYLEIKNDYLFGEFYYENEKSPKSFAFRV
ncbi:hypothetical protein EJ994_13295 [Maribacter sp. MJ134]|uniref:hypothetical protein n=1 Tax=Maribacter sp. MJ134 TaxID=2496865 RepID=UPI000F818FB2|nr:hypothetical protein [Maribacter sp. MJ134]AZQ59727.1 hypothetical protein EJ994_13295 [Maribacter sp. MJ134]